LLFFVKIELPLKYNLNDENSEKTNTADYFLIFMRFGGQIASLGQSIVLRKLNLCENTKC